MRIISPFTDYYDHAVHPSQIDQAVRYIRKTSIVPYSFEKNFDWLPRSAGYSVFDKTSASTSKQEWVAKKASAVVHTFYLYMGILCR